MVLFRNLIVVMLLGTLVAGPAAGAESVDVELVLLADASGSIADDEILFQRRGYADANTSGSVMASA